MANYEFGKSPFDCDSLGGAFAGFSAIAGTPLMCSIWMVSLSPLHSGMPIFSTSAHRSTIPV